MTRNPGPARWRSSGAPRRAASGYGCGASQVGRLARLVRARSGPLPVRKREPQVDDCRDFPDETGCTLYLSGEEEHVVRAPAEHAISFDGAEETVEPAGMASQQAAGRSRPDPVWVERDGQAEEVKT